MRGCAGSWRVDRAFALQPAGTMWTGEVQLLLGVLFEYRAVVCSGDIETPMLVSWEATGARNRYLVPS